MADKTLATFRIDPQEWETFKNTASAEGTNASAVFTEFVRWYNSGNRLGNSTAFADTNLDKTIDKRLDIIEQRLDDRGLKPEIIKEQLEEHSATLNELRSQLEELRGKSIAR